MVIFKNDEERRGYNDFFKAQNISDGSAYLNEQIFNSNDKESYISGAKMAQKEFKGGGTRTTSSKAENRSSSALSFVEELNSTQFESSSGLTNQFSSFYNLFSREFKKFLTGLGATNIKIGRGHFYPSGFFTMPSGQIWYFSLGDVRWDKSFFVRTAKAYDDYTGGSNQTISVDSPEQFGHDLAGVLR